MDHGPGTSYDFGDHLGTANRLVFLTHEIHWSILSDPKCCFIDATALWIMARGKVWPWR
jgi:hypothetical protein